MWIQLHLGNFVVFLVKTLTSHSAFPSMITSSTQWQMGSVGGGGGGEGWQNILRDGYYCDRVKSQSGKGVVQVLLVPQECLASKFSLHYHPLIIYKCHENKGNDHQF